MCSSNKWTSNTMVLCKSRCLPRCLMLPTLVNVFLEFVMKELTSLNTNLQLSDSTCIDVRYADNTTLLSIIFEKLQISTKELEDACKKWGMKVNGPKCKILSPSDEPIQIDGY